MEHNTNINGMIIINTKYSLILMDKKLTKHSETVIKEKTKNAVDSHINRKKIRDVDKRSKTISNLLVKIKSKLNIIDLIFSPVNINDIFISQIFTNSFTDKAKCFYEFMKNNLISKMTIKIKFSVPINKLWCRLLIFRIL